MDDIRHLAYQDRGNIRLVQKPRDLYLRVDLVAQMNALVIFLIDPRLWGADAYEAVFHFHPRVEDLIDADARSAKGDHAGNRNQTAHDSADFDHLFKGDTIQSSGDIDGKTRVAFDVVGDCHGVVHHEETSVFSARHTG